MVRLGHLTQLVASQSDLIAQLSDAVALLTMEVRRAPKKDACPSYIT